MIAYKLVRLNNDGKLYPLFINKKEPFLINEWMNSKCCPTKGFAIRKGFHCCLKKYAPHLKMNLMNGQKRVWVKVEVIDCIKYSRPESQGGTWLLADKMKIICIEE